MSEPKAINSVYNIEIEKIDPNPDQPRKHFAEESLRDLAESIRRYGVMQPITVFRREHETNGGISTRYEIIAGERRWRASILAGMATIPAIIQEDFDSEQDRFELSILENLQREDLNPVDKARSFARLADEFGMKHAEIADRLGKSREYVTNALRLLALPDNILDALSQGEINEGHTRPMLTLKDKPEELQVLFNEIKAKGMTVREAEVLAKTLYQGKRPVRGAAQRSSRAAAQDLDPEMQEIQEKLTGVLGTPVSIDKKDKGGKLTIDFFSREDLKKLLSAISASGGVQAAISAIEQSQTQEPSEAPEGLSHAQEHAPVQEEHQNAEEAAPRAQAQAADAEPQAEATSAPHDPFMHGSTQREPQEDFGDDFTITPQGAAFEFDESLAGKTVQPGSAHEQAPVRQVGSDSQPSGAARSVQDEINELVGQISPEANTAPQATPTSASSVDETGRVQVDLGEMTYEKPQYSQDFGLDENREKQPAPGTSPYDTLGSPERRVESAPVAGATDDFMPREPAQSEVTGGMEMGSDFVPQEERNQPANPHTQEGGEAATSQANFMMGDASSFAPGASAEPNQQAQAPQQPTQTGNPEARTSSEKYPQGDPYRLDDFSL